MPFPKEKIYRSEEYKAYIRTLPCKIVTCGENAEPHHEIGGGTGLKGSDLFCVPLCREHHQELHRTGVKTFWRKYIYDRWQVIAETLSGYVEYKEG